MALEIHFADSEITDIHKKDQTLEIVIRQVVDADGKETTRDLGTVVITIDKPSYKSLPKKGRLSDGELYGIPGKALNGRVPVEFSYKGDCELTLADEKNEFEIKGKGIFVRRS